MWYRHLFTIAFLTALFVVGAPDAAHAGGKISTVINNVVASWSGVTNILSAFAWLAGCFLGVAGIFKFKDHVDNPSQTPLSAGVKRMLAGGMFFSLPFMIRAVRGSLFGNLGVGDNRHTTTGWNSMTGATLSAGGLDKMVVDFISDIARPAELMLVAFSYLSGILLLIVGISRLTKRMEEGPRGPAGIGTIMTFIAAGALFSFGDSIGTFSSSLFGNAQVMTNSAISEEIISDEEDRGRVQAVIEGVMVFVMLVGYIAFIRGWFVLKAFADGQQGATVAQGLTFLLGGSLAINLGELVNALQTTVGIEGITFS
jgi:hypothetical protein